MIYDPDESLSIYWICNHHCPYLYLPTASRLRDIYLFFYLSFWVSPKTGYASCAALLQAGFLHTGYYEIDPDGAGSGVEGFLVFCDMCTLTISVPTAASTSKYHRLSL